MTCYCCPVSHVQRAGLDLDLERIPPNPISSGRSTHLLSLVTTVHILFCKPAALAEIAVRSEGRGHETHPRAPFPAHPPRNLFVSMTVAAKMAVLLVGFPTGHRHIHLTNHSHPAGLMTTRLELEELQHSRRPRLQRLQFRLCPRVHFAALVCDWLHPMSSARLSNHRHLTKRLGCAAIYYEIAWWRFTGCHASMCNDTTQVIASDVHVASRCLQWSSLALLACGTSHRLDLNQRISKTSLPYKCCKGSHHSITSVEVHRNTVY